MRPFRILAAAVFFFVTATFACAQANGDRLILKDGTYQVITKYEIHGDRVRFYSAERHDWEELPSSLVDWAATAKWKHDYGEAGNADQQVTSNPNDPGQAEAAKIDAEARAAKLVELERMPIIQPGLRLPDESGVWVLDTFQGQPDLAHIMQSNGDLNRAYEHSVLPYEIGSKPGARELIRVDGYTAATELHISQPVFYVSLNALKNAPPPIESDGKPLTVDTHGASSVPDDKHAFSSPDSRYVILALNTGRNLRSATARTIDGILGGEHPVALTETTKEILPGGYWLKITPKNPLAFGQYALVEILSPRAVNLDVWAFGINPEAPENKGAVGVVDTQ